MIPKDMLIRRFWLVTPEIPCEDLIMAFLALPAQEQTRWYAVLQPDEGQWAVLSPAELFEAVQHQEEEVLERPLHAVTSLYVESKAIERKAVGIGQARRDMHKQPNRRLVVLEEGQPVGLLCDVFHAGLLGGVPLELYGKRQGRPSRQAITYTCPQCEKVSDFVDLIDPATNHLICPKCQARIAEDTH